MIVGVTPQAVHKRIRAGTIASDATASGQRILKRDGLERRWWGSTQRIADMPDHGRAALAAPDWGGIARKVNGYLGDAWPAPPWSADQVATLALVLEMACDG